MHERIAMRSAQEGDEAFLLRLYASTREDEVGLATWSPEEKQRFVRTQFDLQQRHYRTYYADGRSEIITLEDQPIGRLYTHRSEDEIRIVDIALLPEFRRRGIGGEIIGGLLADAADAGKPVRLHVLQNNPAIGLYRRMEFRKAGETGIHDVMEWRPR